MREDFKSAKLKEIEDRRKKYRLRLFSLISILFLCVIGFISYFSYHPYVTINNIRVNGNHVISEDDIKSQILEDLKSSYFHLFAKSNTFLYPKNRLYNNLQERFPRIENLEIKKSGLNTLDIYISEKIGTYLYCGSTIPEVVDEIGENCYFINDDGYVFDKAPYYSGNVYFKFYLPKVNDGDMIGNSVIGVDAFHRLVNFIYGIDELGFNTNHIYLDGKGIYTLYLERGSNTMPVITFNTDNDLSQILDNLSLSMSNKEFANEIKSKYDNLLYIDLRFDNKVLYKFNE